MPQVNSHIQMPRTVMKNFHNENNELFYYDCQKEIIRRGHAKTLYTEKGYFSNYVERYLDKRVETKLGMLIRFVNESNFELGDNPPNQYEDISFTYLYSLIFRAPEYVNEIKYNSRLFQFLSLINQRDIAVHDSIEMAKEKHLLKEYRVAFLVNCSSEELVLPAGGIVQYGMNLICPTSPWRALVFTKDLLCNDAEQATRVVGVYEIVSKEQIEEINIRAVQQEVLRNKRYVIATSRDLLDKTLKKMVI